MIQTTINATGKGLHSHHAGGSWCAGSWSHDKWREYKSRSRRETPAVNHWVQEIREQTWSTGKGTQARACEWRWSLCRDQLGKIFVFIALSVSMTCIHKPCYQSWSTVRGHLASQLQHILWKREEDKDIKLCLSSCGKKYSGSVSEADGSGSHITAHTAGYFLKQSKCCCTILAAQEGQSQLLSNYKILLLIGTGRWVSPKQQNSRSDHSCFL